MMSKNGRVRRICRRKSREGITLEMKPAAVVFLK
jgi:ribosomal protein L24E